LYHHDELVKDTYSKKSNTNFVSCTIVVMSLILENFASKSLKFN